MGVPAALDNRVEVGEEQPNRPDFTRCTQITHLDPDITGDKDTMKSTHEVEINIDEQAIQKAVDGYIREQIIGLTGSWYRQQEMREKIRASIDKVIDEYLAVPDNIKADEIRFIVDAQIKQRVATKLAKMLKNKEKETP